MSQSYTGQRRGKARDKGPASSRYHSSYRPYGHHRLFVINNPLAPRIAPELAIEIGFEESVLLLQLEFLIATMGEERDDFGTEPGVLWLQISNEDLRRNYFPFWGLASIQRYRKKLVDELKLLLVQTPRGNEAPWVALNLRAIKRLRSLTVCQTSSLEEDNSHVDNSQEDDSEEYVPQGYASNGHIPNRHIPNGRTSNGRLSRNDEDEVWEEEGETSPKRGRPPRDTPPRKSPSPQQNGGAQSEGLGAQIEGLGAQSGGLGAQIDDLSRGGANQFGHLPIIRNARAAKNNKNEFQEGEKEAISPPLENEFANLGEDDAEEPDEATPDQAKLIGDEASPFLPPSSDEMALARWRERRCMPIELARDPVTRTHQWQVACDLCAVNPSRSKNGRVLDALESVRTLVRTGATPAEFDLVATNWRSLDWRGKKGESLPLARLVEDFDGLLALSSGRNRGTSGTSPTPAEDFAKAMEEARNQLVRK